MFRGRYERLKLTIADRVLPGFSVALVGFLALLATVLPTPYVEHYRVLFLFVAFVLIVLEIVAIDAARDLQNRQYQAIMEQFTEPPKVESALEDAEKRSLSHVVADSALKETATNLALAILTFLRSRQLHEPPLPRPETWNRDVQDMLRYSSDTMAQYYQLYGPRVIAIQQEFANRGIRDDKLDQFFEHPTNPIGVRIVAERIGALADRLP